MNETLHNDGYLVLGDPVIASGQPDALDTSGLRTQLLPTTLHGALDATQLETHQVGDVRRVVFPGRATLDGHAVHIPCGAEIRDAEVRLPIPWGMCIAPVDGHLHVDGPVRSEVDVLGQIRQYTGLPTRVWIEVKDAEIYGVTVPEYTELPLSPGASVSRGDVLARWYVGEAFAVAESLTSEKLLEPFRQQEHLHPGYLGALIKLVGDTGDLSFTSPAERAALLSLPLHQEPRRVLEVTSASSPWERGPDAGWVAARAAYRFRRGLRLIPVLSE